MTAQRELLDSVRETCSLPSFKALADRLNVPRQNVHQWLTDERPIPDERIAQLCAMAHIDAPTWLARIHAERAESAVERRAWLSILERLRPAAAVAGLAVALLAAWMPNTGLAKPLCDRAISSAMPIMFRRLRRWLRGLRASTPQRLVLA